MKKIILSTALLMALCATAQDYQWQWAKRGGGTKQSANETALVYGYDSEQVLDIAVDEDNNYYYLTFMAQLNTEFDGTYVQVYNPENLIAGYTDIVLLSTDCEGNLRWSQTIGGGGQDYAYNIALDNDGGLYVGANIFNISSSVDPYLPPHFSPTDALPAIGSNTGEPQEGYKTSALLKYNTTNGDLLWRVMPQGDVTLPLRYSQINHVQVQPDGTIHTLIGFAAGTHLNGQVVIPSTFTSFYKYYIVKFNSEGNVLDALPLSLEGVLVDPHVDFRYDANLQRYYIAGFRNYGGSGEMLALSFNSTPINEQAFILAFSHTGEELWRKEVVSISDLRDNRIYALEIDSDSNLYIAGKYFVDNPDNDVSIGSYQLPTNIIGNINYTMKLNSAGEVQWLNVPIGYNETANPNQWSGTHFSYDIAIKGNEIAVATEVSDESWGAVSINRPPNHWSDPGLLRLNKETGEAIALHDIMTSPQTYDALTAVAVDNDGNYLVGGYFHKDLFTLENDNVPTVTKVAGEEDFTDFFIAKLAANECGTLVTNKTGYNTIKVYPNPTSGIVNVQSQEELSSYEVVNILGQVLLKGEMKQGQSSLTIEGLAAGTYILNITTAEGKVISQKVVRE